MRGRPRPLRSRPPRAADQTARARAPSGRVRFEEPAPHLVLLIRNRDQPFAAPLRVVRQRAPRRGFRRVDHRAAASLPAATLSAHRPRRRSSARATAVARRLAAERCCCGDHHESVDAAVADLCREHCDRTPAVPSRECRETSAAPRRGSRAAVQCAQQSPAPSRARAMPSSAASRAAHPSRGIPRGHRLPARRAARAARRGLLRPRQQGAALRAHARARPRDRANLWRARRPARTRRSSCSPALFPSCARVCSR